MRTFAIWVLALIVFALLQLPALGVIGVWLGVLVVTAAFDVTHGICWTSSGQTGLRALAGLALSVLIEYQTLHERQAGKFVWTLLMAMNFGGFQTIFLKYRRTGHSSRARMENWWTDVSHRAEHARISNCGRGVGLEDQRWPRGSRSEAESGPRSRWFTGRAA